jgi:hypothetical protein
VRLRAVLNKACYAATWTDRPGITDQLARVTEAGTLPNVTLQVLPLVAWLVPNRFRRP